MTTNNTNMPQVLGPYKLTIKLLSANLDRSTDMMGKMDPYCVAEFTRAGGKIIKKVRGPTHKGGHKSPVWNYEFDLYFGGEAAGSVSANGDTIKFTVYEEDTMSSDLVGETAVIPLA
jgi:Ca2+-dependent lipid-binding protein